MSQFTSGLVSALSLAVSVVGSKKTNEKVILNENELEKLSAILEDGISYIDINSVTYPYSPPSLLVVTHPDGASLVVGATRINNAEEFATVILASPSLTGIRGEKGEDGIDGADGIDGVPGAQGPAGPPPVVLTTSFDGITYPLTDADILVCSRLGEVRIFSLPATGVSTPTELIALWEAATPVTGPQGPQGPQGETGPSPDLSDLAAISLPLGTPVPFFGQNLPAGYVDADGSPLSRTVYNDLFQVLGTRYGAGDGVNTFNTPDLSDVAFVNCDAAEGIVSSVPLALDVTAAVEPGSVTTGTRSFHAATGDYANAITSVSYSPPSVGVSGAGTIDVLRPRWILRVA